MDTGYDKGQAQWNPALRTPAYYGHSLLWTSFLGPAPYIFLKIGHFTVVCLVTWPWIGSEAGVDLVLIQTSLLFICKCQLVSIRTAWSTCEKQWVLYQNKVTPASLPIQRQVTKHTTVKWPIIKYGHFFWSQRVSVITGFDCTWVTAGQWLVVALVTCWRKITWKDSPNFQSSTMTDVVIHDNTRNVWQSETRLATRDCLENSERYTVISSWNRWNQNQI